MYGGLADCSEWFVEGEGTFVVLGLDGIALAKLERGISEKACTTTEGKGNGNSVELFSLSVADGDGDVLHNDETDEQDGNVLDVTIAQMDSVTFVDKNTDQ